NLYRCNGSAAEALLPRDADFAAPQWQFAASTYAFVSAETMVYAFTRKGTWFLGRLDLRTLAASDYPAEFASVSGLRTAGKNVVMRCSTPSAVPAIITLDVATGELSPIKHSIPPAGYEHLQPYYSTPQSIRFP